MQRVWATVTAVWATLAIVAVLAWTHGRPLTGARSVPATVTVRLANGTQQVVSVQPAAAPHATTGTSPVPGG